MPRLNYNHLRYFWAVAHNGNLTRTAESLHISQSALSLQIKKLEEQLGQQLFLRQGKKLVLTEAGRVALEHADIIYANGEELLSALQHEGGVHKILRVGALSTLSRNFQIRFLEPLFDVDRARVVVRSGTLPHLLGELEAHRIDVVLTNLVPARDAGTAWNAHTIDTQPISLIGPPDHPWADAKLEQILDTAQLVVPTRETAIRVAFDALTDRYNIRPNLAAEVDDMALLRLMARQRRHLVVVPPIVVTDELSSGELCEVMQLPNCTETFSAIRLERRFPNELLQKLLDV
jgi:LysR family transcriptional activator of nhaA